MVEMASVGIMARGDDAICVDGYVAPMEGGLEKSRLPFFWFDYSANDLGHILCVAWNAFGIAASARIACHWVGRDQRVDVDVREQVTGPDSS